MKKPPGGVPDLTKQKASTAHHTNPTRKSTGIGGWVNNTIAVTLETIVTAEDSPKNAPIRPKRLESRAHVSPIPLSQRDVQEWAGILKNEGRCSTEAAHDRGRNSRNPRMKWQVLGQPDQRCARTIWALCGVPGIVKLALWRTSPEGTFVALAGRSCPPTSLGFFQKNFPRMLILFGWTTQQTDHSGCVWPPQRENTVLDSLRSLSKALFGLVIQ